MKMAAWLKFGSRKLSSLLQWRRSCPFPLSLERVMRLLSVVVKAVLATLRSALFVALVLTSKVLIPVLRLVAIAGILIFGFCALARRDQVTPMWAGAGFAAAAVALELALGAAVRALAPADVVVISEV
jgi:hypothetical protein